MHTSKNSHLRLFFNKVTNPKSLADLVHALGLELVDKDRHIYDLSMSEGSTLTLDEAIREMMPERMFDHPDDRWSIDFKFLLGGLCRMAMEYNVTSHSHLWDPANAAMCEPSCDITSPELFDLINVLSNGYEIEAIYEQWAIFSTGTVFGANSGGTMFTTQYFSTLAPYLVPDRVEIVVETLRKHKPSEMGDYFILNFAMFAMDGIRERDLMNSVQDAWLRHFGILEVPGAGKLKMKDEYVFHAPAVVSRRKEAPTLEYFRNFNPKFLGQVTYEQKFYLEWFALPLHPSGHCPELPENYLDTVAEIRRLLLAGEELDCPAIHFFHNPRPVEVLCEIPTIMPSKQDPAQQNDQSVSRMLSQTGFEKDAVPLDAEAIKGVHLRGAAQARTSQRDSMQFECSTMDPRSPMTTSLDVLEEGRSVVDNHSRTPSGE